MQCLLRVLREADLTPMRKRARLKRIEPIDLVLIAVLAGVCSPMLLNL